MNNNEQASDVEVTIPNTHYIFYPLLVIGRGQYGTVYKGCNKKTNELVAIKHMIVDSEECAANLEREITLLKDKELQSSDHIVRYLDIINHEKNYYLVTELCDSSLNEYVSKTQLTEDEALSILYQIIQGYNIMKKRGIIHRDLKPENILMKNKIPKIADFGSARMTSTTYTEDVGTLPFKAPEILAGLNDYDEMVDMWSLGVTLYYMIFRDYPFKPQGLSQISLLQEINVTMQNDDLFKNESKVKPETQNLIRQMLEIEKEKRIKWIDIEKHLAFEKFKKQIIDENTNKIKDRKIIKQPKPNHHLWTLEVSVPNSNYVFYPFLVLGRGRHGTVYKGSNKKKDKDLAIKNLIIDSEPPANVLRQLNILKDPDLQSHPNIVKYYDIINKDKNYYIIAELCELSLHDYIRKRYSSENEALYILNHIVEGYLALRKKNITHCDIKSNNIMIKNKIVKIADFIKIKGKAADDIVSLPYKAPEILEELDVENEVSDMWSLGVLYYYIIFHELPYKPSQGMSKANLLIEVKKNEDILGKKDIKISLTTQNLLLKMLKKNKDQRIKWDEILDDIAFAKIRNSENLDSPMKNSKETKIESINMIKPLLESKINTESARNELNNKSQLVYHFSDPGKKSQSLIEQHNNLQVPFANKINIMTSPHKDRILNLGSSSKFNSTNIESNNHSGIVILDMTKKRIPNDENPLYSPKYNRNITNVLISSSNSNIKNS